jgi:hypothetical protein
LEEDDSIWDELQSQSKLKEESSEYNSDNANPNMDADKVADDPEETTTSEDYSKVPVRRRRSKL